MQLKHAACQRGRKPQGNIHSPNDDGAAVLRDPRPASSHRLFSWVLGINLGGAKLLSKRQIPRQNFAHAITTHFGYNGCAGEVSTRTKTARAPAFARGLIPVQRHENHAEALSTGWSIRTRKLQIRRTKGKSWARLVVKGFRKNRANADAVVATRTTATNWVRRSFRYMRRH